MGGHWSRNGRKKKKKARGAFDLPTEVMEDGKFSFSHERNWPAAGSPGPEPFAIMYVRNVYIYIYIYIYRYIHLYIYIYIDMCTEREIDR